MTGNDNDDDGKNELAARFDDRKDPSSKREAGSPSDSTNPSNTGSSGGGSSSTSTSPGPDRDPDASRNRKRVYMAVGKERADALDGMFERFEGRVKLLGDGDRDLKKHDDFWIEVADFILDNEEEIADRLDVPQLPNDLTLDELREDS